MAAHSGEQCPDLFEAQACESTTLSGGSQCAQVVVDILGGNWNANAAASGYTMCAGAEVDEASDFAAFAGCELVAGSIKFFALPGIGCRPTPLPLCAAWQVKK